MSEFSLPVDIVDFEYPLITAVLLKLADNGTNLRKTLKFKNKIGITCPHFIHLLTSASQNFTNQHVYNIENVESYFNVNICILTKVSYSKNKRTNIVQRRISIYRIPSNFDNFIVLIGKSKKDSGITNLRYTRYDQCIIQEALEERHFQSEAMRHIKVESFNAVLSFYKLPKINLLLCEDTVGCIQDVISQNINVYVMENKLMVPVFKPVKQKYVKTINLLINHADSWVSGNMNMSLIVNDRYITKMYICDQHPKCKFKTERYHNFTRHREKCWNISTQKIVSRQKIYGDNRGDIEQLIELGYLPSEAVTYRQKYIFSFDIECLITDRDPDENEYFQPLTWGGVHHVVSIAIASNIPDFKTKCFRRQSSNASDGVIMVNAFMDELHMLWMQLQTTIPSYILKGIDNLSDKLETLSFNDAEKKLLIRLRNKLKSFTKLCVYGYNSGKFY